MAGLLRRAARALSLAAALAAAPAAAQLLTPGYHHQPVLVVDPGRHTGSIRRADVDAAGRFVVTASDDKTVRVWNAETGIVERTIRLPSGPGHIGKPYAVAISPDGMLVAAGGFTAPPGEGATFPILLYARDTGLPVKPIQGLPDAALFLAFSPDGRFLAATLGGGNGLRVFDREAGWNEVPPDARHGPLDGNRGAAFARDGRLATTSDDGQVRLYGPGPRFERLAVQPAPGGARPLGIAFSRDGRFLAIGYDRYTTCWTGTVSRPCMKPTHRGSQGAISAGLPGARATRCSRRDDTAMRPATAA
jgi:WD40 repeat protein